MSQPCHVPKVHVGRDGSSTDLQARGWLYCQDIRPPPPIPCCWGFSPRRALAHLGAQGSLGSDSASSPCEDSKTSRQARKSLPAAPQSCGRDGILYDLLWREGRLWYHRPTGLKDGRRTCRYPSEIIQSSGNTRNAYHKFRLLEK